MTHIPLHKRNALRVALQIAPLLETHGLYDLEYDRPTYGLHQKNLPGTLVWRAVRRWVTRKTKVPKAIWYVIVHYPRDEQYDRMTDEEYGREVVRQLDDMLYLEAFESTNRPKEFLDKRRHLRQMQQKERRARARKAAVVAAAPEPVKNTEDWESF